MYITILLPSTICCGTATHLRDGKLDYLVVKYVDDVLGTEKLCAAAAKLHLSTREQKCTIFAKKSEELINAITDNAAKLGLKVNSKKTQMVCVSGNNLSDVSSFIRDQEGNRIVSTDSMKILGFHFGTQPTVQKHIEVLSTKLRKRLWLLRKLKQANASNSDLVGSYCSFIRPVFDYCSNVYHSMLNITQTEHLEKLQKTALKIIFGYDKDYETLLSLATITTLKKRRELLFENFCLKLYENERFKKIWLEERTFHGPRMRKQKILKEKNARTDCLFNSPLYTIRRKINDLLVT